MGTLLKITLVLSIIGGLNWGLVGIFDYNLVESLFGIGTLVTRLIYVIILAASIMNLALLPRDFDSER